MRTATEITPLVQSHKGHNHGTNEKKTCFEAKRGQDQSARIIPPLLKKSSSKMNRKVLDEATLRAKRKLQLACICSLVFMVAEIIGGFMAGSLAIMTDAAHLLSDVAGFCISLFAIWIQTLPSSARLSFGFQRAEVIGAITSVLLIWVLTGCLVYAAIEKFMDDLGSNPTERVNGKLMFIVACIGLVVNLVLMKILGHSHSHGIGGGSHGHSHGGRDDHHGHSHGGNDHHDDDHHEHSHGESDQHDHHSHGNDDQEDHHGHSHGDHDDKDHHGHSHGNYNHEEHHSHGRDDHHKHGHAHGDSEEHDEDHEHSGQEHHKHKHNDHDLEHGMGKSTKKEVKKKLENLNIEAAYIHALGDLIQSAGVCLAGGLIWYNPDWQIADPIATFLFSILVLGTTMGVIKSSIHVLMEGTPDGFDPNEIEAGLRALPNVIQTHDLHIWSLSAGMPSLSVHIISEDVDEALHQAQDYLIGQGIHHTTIQVEKPTKQYPLDCAVIQCGHASPH